MHIPNRESVNSAPFSDKQAASGQDKKGSGHSGTLIAKEPSSTILLLGQIRLTWLKTVREFSFLTHCWVGG